MAFRVSPAGSDVRRAGMARLCTNPLAQRAAGGYAWRDTICVMLCGGAVREVRAALR